MLLPFFNRAEELSRLRRFVTSPHGGLAVVYGRRRCGKSRLLHEALKAGKSMYYLGDERDPPLQRSSLAREMARAIPGFDEVRYPDWDSLFQRWWDSAPPRMTLVLDEFPTLVSSSKEIPSILQRHLDRRKESGPSVILCGSSQAMMQGLVLDGSAPLYGRAREILKIGPLPAGWIQRVMGQRSPVRAVEAYSIWGGVPRYWELAADFVSLERALGDLVLDPLGVLHREPERLLRDDLRETAQATSILSLIGRGSHRLSEIAGRLEKPSTSLSRPLSRLLDLGLVRRDVPFGSSVRETKRTLYRIEDPFLRFWFRFVEPELTRLEARQIEAVERDVSASLAPHVAAVWEDLVRASVARAHYFGQEWRPASSWWGPGLDRKPLEIDVVAESADGKALLLGEAKWSGAKSAQAEAARLISKSSLFPLAGGRRIHLAIWSREKPRKHPKEAAVFTPAEVLRVLR